MKKGNIYYYIGVLLLILTSISYYVILIDWLFGLIFLGGIFCIIKSEKKIWVKVLTAVSIPVLSIILFYLLIFLSFGVAPI